MTYQTRAYVQGVITTIGLILIGLLLIEAKAGWEWRRVTNTRGWQAETAYHYLYDPLPGLIGPKGEAIRRIDVIDVALADFLKRQQPTPPPTK